MIWEVQIGQLPLPCGQRVSGFTLELWDSSVCLPSFILWDKQPLCGVHAGGLKSQGESHLMAYERVKGEPRHLCVL